MKRYFLCLTIFLMFNTAGASMLDDLKNVFNPKSFPLPEQTKVLRKARTMQTGDITVTSTIYTSSLTQKQVKEFFLKHLPGYGWQYVDIRSKLKGVQQAFPNQKMEKMENSITSSLDTLGSQLYFTNSRGNSLTIMFMGRGQNPSGVDFVVSFSQGKSLSFINQELNEVFPVEPRKISGVPLYPNARQVYFQKGGSSITAGYTTSDSIETVAGFYVEKMPNYGWEYSDLTGRMNASLDKEALKKSLAAAEGDNSGSCPSCPGKGISSQAAQYIDNMRMKSIVFQKGKSLCVVSLSGIAGGETNITVFYRNP